MIKELRIGNWIKHTNHEYLGEDYKNKVVQVDIDILHDLNGESLKDWYEPIPLTPEVLLAAGFQNFDNTWIVGRISEWEVHLMKNGFVITHETCDPRIWNIPINTLHGVQNAIFALTGTELEINITKL